MADGNSASREGLVYDLRSHARAMRSSAVPGGADCERCYELLWLAANALAAAPPALAAQDSELLRALEREWRRREEVWRAGQVAYSDGAAWAYKTCAGDLERALNALGEPAAPPETANAADDLP